MNRWLLDTDHFTLFERGDSKLAERIAASEGDAFGVSAVTIEEAMRGRIAHLSGAKNSVERVRTYGYLVATFQLLHRFEIVAFDDDVETNYSQLRQTHRRIGGQDLKIAATAIVRKWTLLTRNTKDFQSIAGLPFEDWTRE